MTDLFTVTTEGPLVGTIVWTPTTATVDELQMINPAEMVLVRAASVMFHTAVSAIVKSPHELRHALLENLVNTLGDYARDAIDTLLSNQNASKV